MKSWFVRVILLIVCCSICLFSTTSDAKKRCRPLLTKLENVQALQRKGYALKKGQSLRSREDKARDEWWQCERSSSFKKTKRKKSKSRKANNKKIKKKQVYKNKKANKQKNKEKNKEKNNKIKSVQAPFSNNQAIDLGSKYPRAKLFSWLKYYQRPARCHKPADLNTFVFCSEDKLVQQRRFEQQYKE